MKKAYAYLRVSGKSQINGDGFKRQIQSIQDYAKVSDFKIETVFKEEAVSGIFDETDRPAFQKMVSMILKNGVRTIIIEGMDRLARDLQIQTTLIAYLASKGITLISARTDQDITKAVMSDPMQRALVQIQGVFSELEKNLLVKKLRVARERKKAETGKCEGRKSYKQDYAHILKEIKRLRRKPKGKKPKTFDKIAEELNLIGYKATNGKMFNGNSVRQIFYRSKN